MLFRRNVAIATVFNGTHHEDALLAAESQKTCNVTHLSIARDLERQLPLKNYISDLSKIAAMIILEQSLQIVSSFIC